MTYGCIVITVIDVNPRNKKSNIHTHLTSNIKSPLTTHQQASHTHNTHIYLSILRN